MGYGTDIWEGCLRKSALEYLIIGCCNTNIISDNNESR